jgi:hypothetical protein
MINTLVVDKLEGRCGPDPSLEVWERREMNHMFHRWQGIGFGCGGCVKGKYSPKAGYVQLDSFRRGWITYRVDIP